MAERKNEHMEDLAKMRQSIADAINEFERATGLVVESVNLRATDSRRGIEIRLQPKMGSVEA